MIQDKSQVNAKKQKNSIKCLHVCRENAIFCSDLCYGIAKALQITGQGTMFNGQDIAC